MSKIYTGSKFFRYVDGKDEPEIIRIYRMPSEKSKSDSVTYIDENGKKNKMSSEYLFNNYKLLKIDGLMMFSIVSNGEVPDVIIALQKNDPDQDGPFAICRQGIYDVFTNNFNKFEQTCYVGISINKDTCPSNINFNDILTCTGVIYNKPVAIYIDDTLDIILSLFSNTRFNKTLLECEKKVLNIETNKHFHGFSHTLKDLLISNSFMYDFRKCFKIMELPFPINKEDESLSIDNVLFLENEIKCNIEETYIVKYSKEIDIKSIKRDYILASSAYNNFSDIFIVGIDKVDGEYIPRVKTNIN